MWFLNCIPKNWVWIMVEIIDFSPDNEETNCTIHRTLLNNQNELISCYQMDFSNLINDIWYVGILWHSGNNGW